MSRDNEQFIGQSKTSRSLPFKRESSLLDYADENFKALRHLVALEKTEAERIALAAVNEPENIQLADFLDQIGLPRETVAAVRAKQEALIPEERRPYLEKYRKTINIIPSIPKNISLARLNPFTQFEKHPPLLFGMGGGSKALCKGLPLDVLSMVLTAEKLRKELGLGRCRIICANGITYTNIPKNPDFSKEGIDRVLSAERDILQLAVERFGIGDHWDVFLETDIEQIIGPDLKKEYDRMIKDADTVSFIGGHHYSIEMAQMWSLLNQEEGGVKLGWFMRSLNKSQAEYIMDEQPFDARYVIYLASRGITNKTSIPYARAGVRLFPGPKGQIDKDAPYICYDPKDRILLSPFENVAEKLYEATRVGGGLRSKYIRRHFGTIIKLFEELIFEKENLLTPSSGTNEQKQVYRMKRIDDELREDEERFSHNSPENNSKVAKRLQFILDYIFKEDRGEIEKIYRSAFPVRGGK